MEICKNCGSYIMADISGKSSDCNCGDIDGEEFEGYVPENIGIGGGDYIEFTWCLDCGMIQGDFPK